MPKLVDENQRKDEIAEAAVQIFAEKGFRVTSVSEIADKAGMSKGNLYFYFDSKEDILSRIFTRFEQQLHDVMDESLSGAGNPVEKIRTLTADLFVLFQDIESTIKVVFDFWTYSLHSSGQDVLDFESFYRRIEEKLEVVLEEGRERDLIRSDYKEQLSSVLIGYVEGQLVQWQINPSSPPVDPVDEHGIWVIIEGLIKTDCDK